MDIKQLTAFREIMLCGSVSQAARNLNRTQPAISASLRRLETDLEMKLFERSGRRLIPVPEAHYLLSEASDLIDRLNATEQNIRSLRQMEKGVLRIVAMPGPSVFLLPKLISRFTAQTNDIKVQLTTRSSPQVSQLMATQNYDLGIGDFGVKQVADANLLTSQIIESACVCAIPANDPLAEKQVITPMDLDGKPMAALHSDHSTHILTQQAFQTAGARFDLRFETQYFLPIFTFVEAGQAFCVVDKFSAESYRIFSRGRSRITFRPLLPEVKLRLALLTPTHRPSSLLARSFENLWTETVTDIENSFHENET